MKLKVGSLKWSTKLKPLARLTKKRRKDSKSLKTGKKAEWYHLPYRNKKNSKDTMNNCIPTNENLDETDKFLERHKALKLTEEGIQNLNRPFL